MDTPKNTFFPKGSLFMVNTPTAAKSRRLKKSAQAGLRQKMKEPESFVLMARINFLIIGNTKRKIPRSR